MHYHLTMLAFRVLPWVVLPCACGEPPKTSPRDTLRSVQGTAKQGEDSSEVVRLFRELLDVDASRVDVLFVTTPVEQAQCGGFAACTQPQVNGYKVLTFWPTPEEVPKGRPFQYAYMLAHELCHVYYFTHGMPDGDPDHLHTECYARPDYPRLYGPEEGYAWQVSQNF